jgi:radical SAM protein with 4Fe4S-binding SPASM domain
MKRFRKVYVEISNVCNLSCRFCPGTKRQPKIMDTLEFTQILNKLRPYTDFVYFHLMGEPLLHPKLDEYLAIAGQLGLQVILTTNGTLLKRQQEMLLAAPALHKVNISLHAFESNDLSVPFEDYLAACFAYGKAATGNKLTVFRLWNQGGEDEKNSQILNALEKAFPKPWEESRKGIRLADKVYLEYGDKFDWPDINLEEGSQRVFCYGLKDQIGVLCDGTVVPCCLDHEGDIPLGNLLTQEFSEILESDRAKAILEGFSQRKATEPLCRRCGYAKRFVK